MADLVFKLVMLHADVSMKEACRVQTVSKEARELGKDKALSISTEYNRTRGDLPPGKLVQPVRYSSSPKRCDGCKRSTSRRDPFSGRVMCEACLKVHVPTIGRTEAKKTYRLTDTDLAPCDRYMTSHRLYGHDIVFFRTQDVIETAVHVHGGRLLPPPPPPGTTVSAAKLKRLQQVEELVGKYGNGHDPAVVNQLRQLLVTRTFIKNGGAGFRNLTECFKAFGDFDKVLKETYGDDDDSRFYANYIDLLPEYMSDREGVKARLRQTFEARKKKVARQEALTKALGVHGLELRTDCDLCRAYISAGTGDLDDIVLTMREMAFLHNETMYFAIFQKLRHAATQQAKREVRDSHGYVWSQYEYETLVEEYMPSRKSLSDDARRIAIRRICSSKVPDWFTSV